MATRIAKLNIEVGGEQQYKQSIAEINRGNQVLNAEMKNPKFLDLLRANIDLRTAYEVLNNDKIIPAAMQFTAKQVEQKLTNKIVANGARPSENGMTSQSASLTKSDVSQLTPEDRREIARRVARGEKIRF